MKYSQLMMLLTALFSLVSAGPINAGEADATSVFSCQYFKNAAELKKSGTKEDMRIQVTGNPHDLKGVWHVQFPNQPEIAATPFEARFGMHGSLGLAWTDADGSQKRAYVAFGESHGDDRLVFFWFNLDKPSTFFPPGYGCDNEAQISSGNPQ